MAENFRAVLKPAAALRATLAGGVPVPGPPGPQGPQGPQGVPGTIAYGTVPIQDSSIIGTIPLWPATLRLAQATGYVPPGEHLINLRVVFSITASQQDDIVTVLCNGRQQSLNFGKQSGPNNVLSGNFLFTLLPGPAGDLDYVVTIDAGGSRDGMAFFGEGGSSTVWDSYITWVAQKITQSARLTGAAK